MALSEGATLTVWVDESQLSGATAGGSGGNCWADQADPACELGYAEQRRERVGEGYGPTWSQVVPDRAAVRR